MGIAAIYQQPSLFPDLTVAENIALVNEPGGVWRRVNRRGRVERARGLLVRAGASIDPARLASTLSLPEQQLVEIARAIGADARIVIMDEPTASLGEHEVRHLFTVIRGLRAAGSAIIYISHRLDEVFEIADRVTVLRDGTAVATRPIAEVDRPTLIAMMVGREVTQMFPSARECPRVGTPPPHSSSSVSRTRRSVCETCRFRLRAERSSASLASSAAAAASWRRRSSVSRPRARARSGSMVRSCGSVRQPRRSRTGSVTCRRIAASTASCPR
jgi:ABC-type sugar transport system ATPase subunit